MIKKFDILIIGAGASGLMAASKFKKRDLAIVDINGKIAKKIEISGGGRSNITNASVSSENYLANREFITDILLSYDQNMVLDFFKKRGVNPILQKDDQYFCKSSSKEIIDVFKQEIKDKPQFLNQKVIKVSKDKNFIIETNRDIFEAKKVVVATGGLSYPKIGATDIGYKIAEDFGHNIIKCSPALVGFTLQKDQFWMKELSGVSIKVRISVEGKSFTQNLLFAHKGISGPAVLNSSLYWKKGLMDIDFLPDKRVEDYLNSNRLISSALPLPKRFIKEFLLHVGLEDKPVSSLNTKDIDSLKILKSYKFAPAGNFGYTKAEVTRGGVDTTEIDPKNMMSRLIDDLYFIGEVLDVTGELGGYNFQWAFSSANRLTL